SSDLARGAAGAGAGLRPHRAALSCQARGCASFLSPAAIPGIAQVFSQVAQVSFPCGVVRHSAATAAGPWHRSHALRARLVVKGADRAWIGRLRGLLEYDQSQTFVS